MANTMEDLKLSTRPSLTVVNAGLTKRQILEKRIQMAKGMIPGKMAEIEAAGAKAMAGLNREKWIRYGLIGAGLLAIYFIFFRGGSK